LHLIDFRPLKVEKRVQNAPKNCFVLDMVAQTMIPALGRLRQEDHEFLVSLGYTVRPYHRKKLVSALPWGSPFSKKKKKTDLLL
jgi:hypothetical protein